MATAFIFHGTEGYPEENWFPWLKSKLEARGLEVIVPHFPTPPVVAAKVDEWFEVLKPYEDKIDPETLIIGHSLGGVFTLRVLEKLQSPIRAAFLVGTPIGVKPVLNFERDYSFSGFDFNWTVIKQNSKQFEVFHSDDDPYVSLGNGETLAKNLGVKLNFIPNAGHFNKKAGYLQFPQLLEKIEAVI